jgi:outer membrane biosynthesis protein TonB
MKQEMEDAEDQPAVGVGRSALLAPILGLFRSRQTVAVAAGVVVMLAVLLAAKTRASGASDAPASVSESFAGAPGKSAVSEPVSNQPSGSLTQLTTAPAVAAANSASAKPLALRPHVEERPSPRASDRKSSETKSIAIPNVPTGVMVRLDSVANAAGASVKAIADFSVRTETPMPNRPRTSLVGDQSNQAIVPTHARPIGEIPTPSYPTQLAEWGVGGEVRSRFTVDATGHPVMSTFSVDGAPNPQLTQAVRRVIAGMRFEPAHAAGTGAPTSDLVVIAFQFAAPSR